jgi:non-ribosomal peptide synthetase component F
MIEQQMLMNGASLFWLDILHEYNLDHSLSLPYDRYRLSNEHRTGRGISISFNFTQDLSNHFLTYVSLNNIKLIDLAVTIYYVFLLKLTNGENDICIGMNTDGRYRDELKSVIGMFVNAIPLRCQLDPHWSFHQLIDHVCEIVRNSLKYSYYPLQRILSQHPRALKPAFLDTSFEFHTTDNIGRRLNGWDFEAISHPINITVDEVASKFDFSLTIEHDLNLNQFSCTIDASLDLFNVVTIQKISQRFHSLLQQLFIPTNDQMRKPIYELSLSLPDERKLMESLNNTQTSFPFVSCIHHEFVYQVTKHPQKLAVELDDQSLTYCELLYYVQLLSLHLLNYYSVVPGEIICQCVERSISMVSCLLKS